MGIRYLFDVIKKERIAISRKLHVFADKRIAIDISGFLMEFIRSKGSRAIKNNHIHGLFYRSLCFLRHNIEIIYIFDGVPPKEKGRRPPTARFRAIERDCFTLLSLMGIRYFRAPAEAEAQCVQLLKEKRVDYVLSNDSDVLALGAEVLLRNLSLKTNSVDEIRLIDVLQKLAIPNYLKFVDFCVLLGTDYNRGSKNGIGPKKALRLILNDTIPVHEPTIRKLFLEPIVSVQCTIVDQTVDLEKLSSFLIGQHKFNSLRVAKALSAWNIFHTSHHSTSNNGSQEANN